MLTFYQWLGKLHEDRRTIAPEILQSYDLEFRRQLERLAGQIPDSQVRSQFQELLDCPIIDSKGNCRDFAEYVNAALVKNGITNRFDAEQSLQYIFEKMLVPKGDSGQTRTTIFTGFDPRTADSTSILGQGF